MSQFRIDTPSLLVDETLYSTANGYIGVRGNFEEGYLEDMASVRGTYINGFYDVVDITYGESAYGFPQTGQKILNVIDGQSIQIYVDGDPFSIFSGQLRDFKRQLDTKSGVATRYIDWVSPKGHHLRFHIIRMTSFEQLELFTIQYSIESVNYTGGIRIFSYLEGNVENYTNPSDPRVGSGHVKLLDTKIIEAREQVGYIQSKTKGSDLYVAAGMTHDIDMTLQVYETGIMAEDYVTIEAGTSFDFTKYVVYTDSLRHQALDLEGQEILKQAKKHGVDYYYQKQIDYLESFWTYSKIDIVGDPEAEEALDYNTYQLLASAGKTSHANISAKGLSGEGYEGHYFWDTEIYMLPLFTLTMQDISRSLLHYRYEILDSARQRARDLGHDKGAKIPWRTINGGECSGYFPAGCAQYHINADVAYAYIQYYLYTGDFDFMKSYGLEVLYETARIWLEMGYFHEDNTFKINEVTGPDEYTALVNNNYYTNAMAAYHLSHTLSLMDQLKEEDPESYQELKKRLHMTLEELQLMKRAAKKMYMPYDDHLGIHLQDDSFLDRKPWDFDNTPKSHHPLLLYYHPLKIYRHQVLKQADTVLAYFLLDDVSDRVMERGYDYYEPLTTHDSSLSLCVYAMMAARIGKTEESYDFFKKTLRLDLDNLHHNTKDGLHIANTGGAYMGMVYGFGGFRIKPEGIVIRPLKPKAWDSYTFRLNYRGQLVTVQVADTIVVTCDKPIQLTIYNKEYQVSGRLEVALEQ